MGFITVALIIGVAAAITAGTVKVISTFWKKIVTWTTKCIETAKKVLKIVPVGVKTLIKKFEEGFKEIVEHYSKLSGNRYRRDTIITKEIIPSNEVPDDIKSKAFAMRIGESTDISSECNRELLVLNQ